MTTITVQTGGGLDEDGNPTASGGPVELTPLEIAPGNTVLRYGVGADLDDVQYTVYLPLRTRTAIDVAGQAEYTPTVDLIPDDSTVTVYGKPCKARTQVWQSQRGTSRGGVVVLCRSITGASGG